MSLFDKLRTKKDEEELEIFCLQTNTTLDHIESGFKIHDNCITFANDNFNKAIYKNCKEQICNTIARRIISSEKSIQDNVRSLQEILSNTDIRISKTTNNESLYKLVKPLTELKNRVIELNDRLTNYRTIFIDLRERIEKEGYGDILINGGNNKSFIVSFLLFAALLICIIALVVVLIDKHVKQSANTTKEFNKL